MTVSEKGLRYVKIADDAQTLIAIHMLESLALSFSMAANGHDLRTSFNPADVASLLRDCRSAMIKSLDDDTSVS
jgi:hypothetical protein